MGLNKLNLFLTETCDIFDNSIDKAIEVCTKLNKYTINDKISIDNFAFDNKLSPESAKTLLDILCDMQIMQKTERMYRCPKCRLLLGVLTEWDEGDDITCYNCETTHPHTDICDTETIYNMNIIP